MAKQDESGHFGEMLLRRRMAAGPSQQELAERAGLSQRGISDLEHGKRRGPHPATVRRLAEALGLADADANGPVARVSHARQRRLTPRQR